MREGSFEVPTPKINGDSIKSQSPARSARNKPSKPQRRQRFDLLAKQNGWEETDLRKCFDLPKNNLPVGSRIIRMPSAVFEDPFKGHHHHHSDPEQEYEALETRFYNKLSKMTIQTSRRRDMEKIPQNHVRIKITGDESTSGIHFNVNRKSVDTNFVLKPKKQKKK